jgi:hypothetical protein
MDKRQFLLATALGVPGLNALASGSKANPLALSPPLLTITGKVGRTNRGPLDYARDQLMVKHDLRFERAFSLDFWALTTLPQVKIRPTVEYDAKVHDLHGPSMIEVLTLAGVSMSGRTRLSLRAIDGYAAEWTLADLLTQDLIVATHLDGKPMPLGGLGPLWAVYEADSRPKMADKSLTERFARCPWGLYHVGVDEEP